MRSARAAGLGGAEHGHPPDRPRSDISTVQTLQVGIADDRRRSPVGIVRAVNQEYSGSDLAGLGD